MDPFDYFRKTERRFTANTPSKALMGFEMGLDTIEDFIYLATSVKQLNEEPINLLELERILNARSQQFDTVLYLNELLNSMINHKDMEIALFAAESLNIIEKRYMTKIEKCKARIKKKETRLDLSELGRLYYELALLNGKQQTLRTFYLSESAAAYKKLHSQKQKTLEDVCYYAKVLIALGTYRQARMVLENSPYIANSQVLILLAETAFYEERYDDIFQIMSDAAFKEIDASVKYRWYLHFWLENDE